MSDAAIPKKDPPPVTVQKFIRTFETDMATIKRGEVPNLIPLKDAPKKEVPAAPAPAKTSPPAAPPPAKPVPPPPPRKETKPVEIPKPVSPIPVLRPKLPAPPPPPAAPAPVDTSGFIEQAETYAKDFAKAAQRIGSSLASSTSQALRAAEQREAERRETIAKLKARAPQKEPPKPPDVVITEDIPQAPKPEVKPVPLAISPAAAEEARERSEIIARLKARVAEEQKQAQAESDLALKRAAERARIEAKLKEESVAIPRERLVEASVLPPEPPPQPIARREIPLPPPPQEENASPLHTYASDFSEHIQDTHASTATILASEQDAGQSVAIDEIAPRSRTLNLVYGIGGAVLLIGTGVSAYVAYMFYQSHPASILPAPTVAAPIFVDERVHVDGVGSALETAIADSVAKPLAGPGVRLLYTGSGTTTSTNLFSRLQLPAPGILLRNVHDQGSIAGVIQAGSTQSPFFILSVLSYGDTFAGMLSWEPHLSADLSLFFPAYPVPPVATTTATSTPQNKTPTAFTILPPAVLIFRDETIANHDVRIYRDAQGRSQIVYGYWNPSTLIIARDEAAFKELVTRLGTSRTQ